MHTIESLQELETLLLNATFDVCDGVEAFTCEGRHVLFHDGLQQLVELNETAHLIWSNAVSGSPAAPIVASLEDKGANATQACAYTSAALDEWTRGGWLLPSAVFQALAEAPRLQLDLSIFGAGFSVEVYEACLPAGLAELLEPLKGTPGPAPAQLRLVPWRGHYFLLLNRSCRGRFAGNEIVSTVKAVLTEQLSRSQMQGFLAHGALVQGPPGRIFLSGAPGAGKSTLAAALVIGGFDCLSDDLVQIDPAASARGAPFPLTLKHGSWPLLDVIRGVLNQAPIHQRADGQTARYLPSLISQDQARPLDHFIQLQRRPGPATLVTAPAIDALRNLLDGSVSPTARISAGQVRQLARAFCTLQSYILSYAHLDEAVALISQLGAR